MHKKPNRERDGASCSTEKLQGKHEVFTPIKSIRLKCIECSGGSRKEAASCHITTCYLWPYRMGHRPTAEMLKEREEAHA